jgi:hypothetical protein
MIAYILKDTLRELTLYTSLDIRAVVSALSFFWIQYCTFGLWSVLGENVGKSYRD